MIINIKNMVCQRCKIVVSNILNELGLEAESIALGEIVLKNNICNSKLNELAIALKEADLELVVDKKNLIDQQIKNLIFEHIHYHNEPLSIKFSCYLSRKLNYNYTYLSKVFSEINGINIERYIIQEKIEKVKSMLISEGVILSEIAYKMNYSSVSHLSNQFKKHTGVRARDYKLLKGNKYRSMPPVIAIGSSTAA